MLQRLRRFFHIGWPCPLCTDRFSLRKPHGIHWHQPHEGQGICPQCTAERQGHAEWLVNKYNLKMTAHESRGVVHDFPSHV